MSKERFTCWILKEFSDICKKKKSNLISSLLVIIREKKMMGKAHLVIFSCLDRVSFHGVPRSSQLVHYQL